MEPEAVSDTPDRRHRSEIVADLVAERKRTYDLERENAALRERIAELEAALRSNAESAMQAHGASFEDLHICGNCNGTGYTA